VSPVLLMLLSFLAVALAIGGVYSILSDVFLRDKSRVSKRMDEELRKRNRERARKSTLFKNLSAALPEDTAEGVVRESLRQRFEAMIEQSGLEITPRRLLLIMAGCGLGVGFLVVLLTKNLMYAGLGAVIATAVPYLYVSLKRKWRLAKLTSQLPDTFDLMARVIRAGQTMSQALQAVADEFDAPISTEFSYCYEQQNLGLSPELAMRDLARRTGLLEIKIFVLALLVQQQTGGNLAELLDKLSTVIRERFRLQGKITTLTAEGRMQAAVLLAMPPALFLMILLMNRSYGQILLDTPMLLVGTAISEVLGALWIRKIINFDY
jgi:tight adherence protein B